MWRRARQVTTATPTTASPQARRRVLPGGSSGTAFLVTILIVGVLTAVSPDAVIGSAASAPKGTVETVAGGAGQGPASRVAQNAVSVAVSSQYIYVADNFYHVVRRIALATGFEDIVAGRGDPTDGHYAFSGDGGPATAASLGVDLGGMAVDQQGRLYIAVSSGGQVLRVDQTGTITVVAGVGLDNPPTTDNGDGKPATLAKIGPQDVAVDSAGNLYLTDWFNNSVRKLDPDGIITTVAGGGNSDASSGGPGTSAILYLPESLVTDANGNVYVTASSRQTSGIYRITPAGTISIAYNSTPGPWQSTSRAICILVTSGHTP